MNILLSRILFHMELLSDIYIDLFDYLLVLPVFSVAYIYTYFIDKYIKYYAYRYFVSSASVYVTRL